MERRIGRLFTPSIRPAQAALALAICQIAVIATGVVFLDRATWIAGLVFVVASTSGWFVLVLASIRAAERSSTTGERLARVQTEEERPTIFDPKAGRYVEWYVRHRIDEEIARSTRSKQPFALLFVSPLGKRFPTDAAQVLSSLAATFREADLVVHLGKLRFVVVLADTEKEGAKLAAERLLPQLPLQDIRVGLACFPDDGDSWEQLVTAAGATAPDFGSAEPGPSPSPRRRAAA